MIWHRPSLAPVTQHPGSCAVHPPALQAGRCGMHPPLRPPLLLTWLAHAPAHLPSPAHMPASSAHQRVWPAFLATMHVRAAFLQSLLGRIPSWAACSIDTHLQCCGASPAGCSTSRASSAPPALRSWTPCGRCWATSSSTSSSSWSHGRLCHLLPHPLPPRPGQARGEGQGFFCACGQRQAPGICGWGGGELTVRAALPRRLRKLCFIPAELQQHGEGLRDDGGRGWHVS